MFGTGIYTSATSSKFVQHPSSVLGLLSNCFGGSNAMQVVLLAQRLRFQLEGDTTEQSGFREGIGRGKR